VRFSNIYGDFFFLVQVKEDGDMQAGKWSWTAPPTRDLKIWRQTGLSAMGVRVGVATNFWVNRYWRG